MIKKTAFFVILLLTLFSVSGCVKVEKTLENGGVYKSVNSGKVWRQKVNLLSLPDQQKFLDNVIVNVLVFDPQDSNTLYLGTAKNGLFVSFDSAESWQEVKRFPKKKINAIVVHPRAKHIVYVATDSAVYKTTDANRTWESVYLEADPGVKITSLQIDKSSPEVIFIGFSDGRLIKSNDEGTSWTNINKFDGEVKQILINPDNNQIIFLVINNKGIYRSEDRGKNWLSLKDNHKNLFNVYNVQKIYFVPNLFNALVCITENKIFRSDNYGNSWSPYNLLSANNRLRIYSFAFNPQDSRILYYTTVKALYQSIDNGDNWIIKPLPNKRIPAVFLVDPVNSNTFYLGFGDVFKN